jgi:DNA replication protein DnaC
LHNPRGLLRTISSAYANPMARPDCPKCGGTGWKIIEGERELSPAVARVPELAARQAAAAGASVISIDARTGASAGQPRVAVLCDCVEAERTTRGLNRARIPVRYEHCDFVNYETDVYEGAHEATAHNRSLTQAKVVVEGFARDYPLTMDAGLLLIGPCGVGKTHLAVAVAKQLIARGHEALFYDYRELLKEIQGSYNAANNATEAGVLEPVLNVEVLLLDDLGASKPSAWALETIGHILTTRYNEKRVTLLTTNYLDAPDFVAAPPQLISSAGSRASESSSAQQNSLQNDLSTLEAANQPADPNDTFAARRAGRAINSARDMRSTFRLPSGESISGNREDTLTERIGTRIRSRLYEMCRTVELKAPDFRKEIRKANLPR